MLNLKVIAIGLAVTGAVVAGVSGAASAATATDTANTDVGTSGIPRTVFTQDHLQAEATVLHITTTAVTTAHKNKTFKQLLDTAGFAQNTKGFATAIRADLTSELTSQGYTKDQVTIALQHREIVRLHHRKQ